METLSKERVAEIKKLLLGYCRCEDCGQLKADVVYTEEPFMLEIHDKIEMMWLCDDCEYERGMDIRVVPAQIPLFSLV